MGNVEYFTLPNNKQKMEDLRSTFEDELREEIAKYGNISKMKPQQVAQIIRRWYANRMEGLTFPVIQFAKDLDIQVIVADFANKTHKSRDDQGNLKGYLGLYPNKADMSTRIVVSNTESYGHQRWTVAHEIWHYLMHATEERTEVDYYPEDSINYGLDDASEEANANKFATELLMPETTFKVAYKETSRWRRKHKLALMFMVSQKAIKRRICELKL